MVTSGYQVKNVYPLYNLKSFCLNVYNLNQAMTLRDLIVNGSLLKGTPWDETLLVL